MSIKTTKKLVLGMSIFTASAAVLADGWDPTSQAGATGSIADTRHNLTLSYNSNGAVMNFARNNYGEVCVYCHTPHGANKQVNAPLWNRTVNDTANYVLYDKPTTIGLEGRMSVPGPSSLTCLSCHDGTVAIDSVLNMPGSGMNPSNGSLRNDEISTGTPNIAFLDTWVAGGGGRQGTAGNHFTLGGELGTGDTSSACALCHSAAGSLIPDYRLFMLGTDLRNDHIIGVQFPTTFGPDIDFNEPDITIPGRWAFFDTNGNGYAEKTEVRLYDSGQGPEVECASCHDPHGIPSNGKGTRFNPSFLRINNSIVDTHDGAIGILSAGPSELCLTCHAK